MKKLPIPKIEQIKHILDGSFYELVCEYVENPFRFDLKEYITINRRSMIRYLRKRPGIAEDIFQVHKKAYVSADNDVFKILQDGSCFAVVWMDHRTPRIVKRFETAEEAVTEFIFVNYGM